MNTGAPFPSVEVARERVLHFQRKLHEWASDDASGRSHDLWNLICDPATLVVALSGYLQETGFGPGVRFDRTSTRIGTGPHVTGVREPRRQAAVPS